MSLLTKKALITSFMKLLKEKSFDKITIRDITSDCGVTRMTFYYHFKDIYDMLNYVIEEKMRASISQAFTYETWRQDYTAVFDAVLKEKAFFAKICSSVDWRKIEVYLTALAHSYIAKVIDKEAERLSLSLNEKKRDMVCDIYGYCMVGLLLNWISSGMKEDPQACVGRFYHTIKGTLEVSLRNAV